MKNRFTLMASVILASSMSYGQLLVDKQAAEVIPGSDVVRFTDRSTIPAQVEFDDLNQKNRAFSNPAEVIKDVLKLDKSVELKSTRVNTDPHGITHFHYQQMINGIPVEGATYSAHKKSGLMLSINGDFFTVKDAKATPTLSEKAALDKALENYGAKKYLWENTAVENDMKEAFGDPNYTHYPTGKLVYYPENGKYTSESKFHLAYTFDVYAEEPYSAYKMYVNAETGEVMDKITLIHTADEKVKAKTRYSGIQEITVNNQGGRYCLNETGRGNGIVTYNAQSGAAGGSTQFCSNTKPIDLTNAAKDEVGCDAHYASEVVYDYFKLVHGRNSLDNRGFKLIAYVHVNRNWLNASWNGRYMSYGDGNATSNNNPLTTMDIGAHEIGHGLTTNTSNLVYRNEPGALNESFSDIWGNVCQRYSDEAGWSEKDWEMGEDLNWSIRSMTNPNKFRHPDTYRGTHWHTAASDNGGVHINSGVQNHWFYRMVAGGQGANDNNDQFNVTGIGWEAAAAISFDNVVNRLRTNSQYADARAGAVMAAKEIYGECSQEHKTTEDAWHAVGVGQKSNCTVVDKIVAKFDADKKTICTGQEVQFSDMSEGDPTAWKWEFQNGTPATSTEKNPKVVFNTPGKHTVKLTITKGAAKDDTEEKEFIMVSEPKKLPVAEDFEDKFPGEGWMVDNPDGDKTWEKSEKTGVGSKSCLYINNADYKKVGELDALMLPETDLNAGGGNDPVLTFFVAYTKFNDKAEDKLKIHISDDCGESWDEIYSKTKDKLETKEVDFDESQDWVPEDVSDWRWEVVELSKYKGKKSVKIKFESTNDYGNNIWIDNINIDFTSGKNTLNSIDNSLVVAPNPNNGQFSVRFNATQKANYNIQVRNILGEVVYSTTLDQFSGIYTNNINLSNNAKGIYLLSVESENGSAIEKIIKK